VKKAPKKGRGQQAVSKEHVAALDGLKHELARAQARFREAGDGGCEGALESLRAIVRFFDRFDAGEISDLLQPILTLGLALSQFGSGVREHPMFATPPKRGRPRDHREWNAAKALAAVAVTILAAVPPKQGAEPRARRYVARILRNAGLKQPSGDLITAEILRAWRQDAMQGDATEPGSVAAYYRKCKPYVARTDGVSAQAHADKIIKKITGMIFAHLRS